MAAPWAAGAKARIIGVIHGQTTVNVIHFATNTQVNDGPPLDALLLQLAQALKECIIETLLPGVTQDWQFLRVEASRIFPAVSDPVVQSGVPTDVGELSPASTSFESAMVTLRTGGAGRRGRGKMFLPPPGEAAITASDIDAPTLLLLAAFCACMATKFGTDNPTTDWRIGVLSKKNLASAGGTFDNSFRTITQMTPAQVVAQMGSRKKGRGV